MSICPFGERPEKGKLVFPKVVLYCFFATVASTPLSLVRTAQIIEKCRYDDEAEE